MLKLLGDAGCSFDVVSGGELYRVQQALCETSRVCFAGVGKTDEEIRFALEAGILMFTVESDPERRLRESFAGLMQAAKQIARVGSPEQIGTAAETMNAARRDLYAMLGGDE